MKKCFILILVLCLILSSPAFAAVHSFHFVFRSKGGTDKEGYVQKKTPTKFGETMPKYTDMVQGDQAQFWFRDYDKVVLTKKATLTINSFPTYQNQWTQFRYNRTMNDDEFVQYGGKCLKFSGLDFYITGQWVP